MHQSSKPCLASGNTTGFVACFNEEKDLFATEHDLRLVSTAAPSRSQADVDRDAQEEQAVGCEGRPCDKWPARRAAGRVRGHDRRRAGLRRVLGPPSPRSRASSASTSCAKRGSPPRRPTPWGLHFSRASPTFGIDQFHLAQVRAGDAAEGVVRGVRDRSLAHDPS